jgi:type VI secretion system protein ImpF
MALFRNQAKGEPSILDRLIDENPDLAQESNDQHGLSLDEIRENIGRDLEALLNTRISWLDIPERFPRVSDSIVAYGIPDLNNVVLDSRRSVDWLRDRIAESISRFDKRLSRVMVRVESLDSETHQLKLRIDAVLAVDPEPIAVHYVPFLDFVRREFKISRSQSDVRG